MALASKHLAVFQTNQRACYYASRHLHSGRGAICDEVRNLTAGGNTKILVNLEEVPYIDSSGIGELVAGFASAARAGGTMKLLDPTRGVKDLLRMTKLSTVFEVHEDAAHAVRSFE